MYSLDTYERRRVIQAHRGSVLGFCLSADQTVLFSSATDPIVNVSILHMKEEQKLTVLGLVYVDVSTSVCAVVAI